MNPAAEWWPAPAKLNLFLHVIGRRADGYHELQTIFRILDYCDYLGFQVREDGVVRRLGNPELPPRDLSVRAAELLREQSGCRLGVDIVIDKRIPAGAGLGGGSSDAATTLRVLNRLWGTGFADAELSALGATLGADVPVFLGGGTAWAEGIGERLTPCDLEPAWYCVVVPPVVVATAAVFADPELTRDSPVIKIRDFLAGRSRNDLEPVTCRRFPAVAGALEALRGYGDARMTGSGAAVFVEVADRNEGLRILDSLPAGLTGFVAHSIEEPPGPVSETGAARPRPTSGV